MCAVKLLVAATRFYSQTRAISFSFLLFSSYVTSFFYYWCCYFLFHFLLFFSLRFQFRFVPSVFPFYYTFTFIHSTNLFGKISFPLIYLLILSSISNYMFYLFINHFLLLYFLYLHKFIIDSLENECASHVRYFFILFFLSYVFFHFSFRYLFSSHLTYFYSIFFFPFHFLFFFVFYWCFRLICQHADL